MKAYQADIAKFTEADSQVAAISVDSAPALAHWAEHLGVTYPMLSDFKREVVKKYGIYNEQSNMARRATFVVDKEGIIQHIEEGGSAIDPTGAHTVCARLPKKAS
jgi:mycoredoxin-dependent peroxiredoxin